MSDLLSPDPHREACCMCGDLTEFGYYPSFQGERIPMCQQCDGTDGPGVSDATEAEQTAAPLSDAAMLAKLPELVRAIGGDVSGQVTYHAGNDRRTSWFSAWIAQHHYTDCIFGEWGHGGTLPEAWSEAERKFLAARARYEQESLVISPTNDTAAPTGSEG